MKKIFSFTLMTTLLSLSAAVPCFAKPDWQILNAHYEVPVEDNIDLKEFASFEMEDAKVRGDKTQFELSYSLPIYLVGEDAESIHFKGPKDNLVSDLGTGKCDDKECFLIYNEKFAAQVGLNLEKIEGLIIRDFDEQTALKKIEVARRFAGDPIGVIVYDAGKINYLPEVK